MTRLLGFGARRGQLWKCDGCGVTSIESVLEPEPVGWDVDRYPGGPHHYCPECVVVYGIDVGDEASWEAAGCRAITSTGT